MNRIIMVDGISSKADKSLVTQCCIVGGGPAGMMLGYLLGRAGIKTVVLEKHADFFRDFRGDTVHPSTMKVMQELGLLEDFLKIPHDEVVQMNGLIGATSIRLADMSRLNTPCRFIAFMPQWDFLNFIDEKGGRFSNLQVMKKAEAVKLLKDGDRVTGIVAETENGPLSITADLTVACDGRHSLMRDQAEMVVNDIGAPMDVLWFRVGKPKGSTDSVFARLQAGQMMVMLDRTDYWQCAYVIAKNGYDVVKAKGLDAFRANIVKLAPIVRDTIGDVKGSYASATLRMRCHRSEVSASISRFRTRWRLQIFCLINLASPALRSLILSVCKTDANFRSRQRRRFRSSFRTI